ncbi:MAG: DUF58 domain-containing protein [Thermoplasmatota archaeon]
MGQLRPTRRLRLLVALGGGLLLAGFLLGSTLPGILAVVLFLYLLFTREAAAAAFRQAKVHVQRHTGEDVWHEGGRQRLRLDASASHVPERVRLHVEELLPPGLRQVQKPREGELVVQVERKGTFRFLAVSATLEDGRGLWEQERLHPLPATRRALASNQVGQVGQRIARRRPLQVTLPELIGFLSRDQAFETLRPFMPGDRLRDLDWKRTARFLDPIAKKRENEQEAALILLLDAGRTMRAQQGGSKLDHAISISIELTQAAVAGDYAVGLVAFDGFGVVAAEPVRASRDNGRRIAEALSGLPQEVVAARRPPVADPDVAPTETSDAAFLQTVAMLRSGARSHKEQDARRPGGLSEAIGQVMRQRHPSRLLVMLLTDLEAFPSQHAGALAPLARQGHRVVTVVLPGSSHLRPPEPISPEDLETAYRERQTRRVLSQRLRGRGIQVMELAKDEHADKAMTELGEGHA